MSDEQEQMMALVPVAEPIPDDTTGLPVVDWRGFQHFAWEFTDWLQDNIRPIVGDIVAWWQASGLDSLRNEHERIRRIQRQRITAAKRRARVITRAKGAA